VVFITAEVTIKFHDAGHILGSAIIELSFNDKGKTKRSFSLGIWAIKVPY
jgi:Cft2 family RNA processing exonuclease